jgi:hypothetical protein
MYDEYPDNEQEITPATPPPLDSLDEMTVTSSPAERYNEIRAVGDHAQVSTRFSDYMYIQIELIARLEIFHIDRIYDSMGYN